MPVKVNGCHYDCFHNISSKRLGRLEINQFKLPPALSAVNHLSALDELKQYGIDHEDLSWVHKQTERLSPDQVNSKLGTYKEIWIDTYQANIKNQPQRENIARRAANLFLLG